MTSIMHQRITESTDNMIVAIFKGIRISQLIERMVYFRYKRMQSKKYGFIWRRYNRGIACCRIEIEEVLSPNWCKQN